MEIEATELANGDLELTLGESDRAELAFEMETGRGFWAIMGELFGGYAANGSFTPFDAGDANPFVGLTSAPCIAETMNYDDDGAQSIVGRYWFNADYMIVNELETLRDEGRFVYSLAR